MLFIFADLALVASIKSHILHRLSVYSLLAMYLISKSSIPGIRDK
jgi:hypothetical protein